MTKIVCQQLTPQVTDLQGNCALALAAIREAVELGADVIVLPELVTSGYVFESLEEARSVALTRDDRVFSDWASEAARGAAVVIGGFCERGDDSLLYNSAVVVDGSGVLGVHRKTHLWDREKLFFAPGDEPPRVFDTAVGRIGLLICYELEFPELTRTLALAGADLIAVPTNWPRSEWPAGEHPPEVIVAMATARVNRVFVACCDRTGIERAQQWTAGTAIIDQTGWLVARQAQAGPASADVDLALARDKRWTERAHALSDRRPELYGQLTAEAAPTVAES
jgi:predicted amidohydrolase